MPQEPQGGLKIAQSTGLNRTILFPLKRRQYREKFMNQRQPPPEPPSAKLQTLSLSHSSSLDDDVLNIELT